MAHRDIPQRLVVKHGQSLAERCRDVARLDIREVSSNPIAAGLAARGSRLAHAHDARTVYAALTANLFFGTPFLITRRVVAPQHRSAFRTLAYNRAARLAAVSSAVVAEMEKRHPNPDIAVVPDATTNFAVHQPNVEQIRAAHPGKILIGHVAALDHSHKGQSTIIEMAHAAAQRHPDWHFLLCGDGEDEARFRAEIGGLSNIELVGWVDNVGDYLAAFDLFVYPSLHEALGSTLLDAMQFGLPIVASNVGGIPELVEEGINGRLVEPGNAVALEAAVAALLDDEEELGRMRAANTEKSLGLDATHMADAYETLYREISGQL